MTVPGSGNNIDSLNRDTVLQKVASALYRRAANEVVVVRTDHNDVLVLNEVAARVMEIMDEGASVAEVLDRLLEEFEVEPDELERDLLGHLRELVDAGILEVVQNGLHD